MRVQVSNKCVFKNMSCVYLCEKKNINTEIIYTDRTQCNQELGTDEVTCIVYVSSEFLIGKISNL